MKIRTGFVSNSSSSSFLLAYAKVNMNNIKEFDEWKNKNKELLKNNDVDIINVKNYDFSKSWDYKKHNNNLSLESFDDSLTMTIDPSDELIVCINYCGNEGDGAFYEDADYEPNYDVVDMDWFDDDYKNIIDDFAKLKDIFSTYNYTCGAGRNG